MKLFFAGLFIFFDFAAFSQTCIIVYVSNNGIVAGADRKYHQTISQTDAGTGKQEKKLRVYYGRKIFTGSGCNWALSGADYYDTLHRICRQSCEKDESINKIITSFQKRVRQKSVKIAMHKLFLISDEAQKRRFKENLTEIVFFKFDANAYKAYRVTISMPGVFNGDETLRFETDSVVASKKIFGIFVLGHYDAFTNKKQEERWDDPVATIRRLIREQSGYTPADVSAESDIVRVRKTGLKWVKGN